MNPLKLFLKILKWLSLLLLLLFTSLIVIAIAYEDEIKQKVVKELNKKLNAEVSVKQIEFSVIKKFPQASILFNDVEINSVKQEGTEKNPYWKRKLIKAKEISLQFNLFNILSKNYKIKKLEVEDATINLLIAKDGKTNFDILKKDSVSTSGQSVSFKLNSVLLSNVKINYYDPKIGNYIEVKIIDSKLKGDFFENNYTLDTKGNFYVVNLKLENTQWLKNRNLKTNFNLNVNNNEEFVFNNSSFNIEQLSFLIDGKLNVPKNKNTIIDYVIKANEVNIHQLLSLLPTKYAEQAKEYDGSGMLDLNVSIKGEISAKKNPVIKSQFSINNGAITHKESNTHLKNISFKGVLNSFETKSNKNNIFKLENFTSTLGNGNISGSVSITDFENPNIAFQAKTLINLDEFLTFLAIDTIENPSGKLNLSLNYNGKLRSKSEYENINLKDENLIGELILEDANFKFKHGKFAFTDVNTKISSTKSDVTLNYLKGKAGNSDFNLQGELTNLLSFLFKENESLKVNATLNSSKIDLNEILSNKDESKKADSTFKFHLSDKFDVNLLCNVQLLTFEKFNAANLKGRFILLDKQIKLDNITFNAMDGTVNATAVINGKNDAVFEVKSTASLSEINMSKFMYQLNNFGQDDLTDKNLKGKLTSTIQFYGKWNSNLTCITSSINSIASILITNGELINFEPMQNLSRFISVEELNSIKFSELKNTLEIKDRVITIPGMLIKSSALDVSASGTHNFDNIVDYHFKVKMADLLFRKAKTKKQDLEEFAEVEDGEKKGMNLYISMTGPIDDPKIKYDKQGFKKSFKEIKSEEKNEVKGLLKEEFGWFKNQPTSTKKQNEIAKKEPQIEWVETKETEKKGNELPKLKSEKKSDLKEKKKNTKKEKTENADDFN